MKEYSGFVLYNREGVNFSQTESELIAESLRRILSTRRGERINNLAFGSDIHKYFFLPEITVEDLVKEVKDSIKRCEPRVDVLGVQFSHGGEMDVININVTVRIKSSNEIVTTDVQI